jgi:hypothetical protein
MEKVCKDILGDSPELVGLTTAIIMPIDRS